jgi:hypothetical protein
MGEMYSMTQACPGCDSTRIDERKTMSPDWRCRICGEVFNEPVSRRSRRHDQIGGGEGMTTDREQYESAIVPALRELVDAGQQYARASHINEFADIDARNARVGDLLHAHGLDRGDVSLWSATNPCVYQIHLDPEEGDA